MTITLVRPDVAELLDASFTDCPINPGRRAVRNHRALFALPSSRRPH